MKNIGAVPAMNGFSGWACSGIFTEEKLPQKEELIKYEQEEKRDIPVLPPISENRKLLQ